MAVGKWCTRHSWILGDLDLDVDGDVVDPKGKYMGYHSSSNQIYLAMQTPISRSKCPCR